MRFSLTRKVGYGSSEHDLQYPDNSVLQMSSWVIREKQHKLCLTWFFFNVVSLKLRTNFPNFVRAELAKHIWQIRNVSKSNNMIGDLDIGVSLHPTWLMVVGKEIEVRCSSAWYCDLNLEHFAVLKDCSYFCNFILEKRCRRNSRKKLCQSSLWEGKNFSCVIGGFHSF